MPRSLAPARGKTGTSRRVALALGAAAAVSSLAYVGISAYVARKLIRMERRPLTTTPATYGLEYEDVQFTSAIDHVLLKGWFIGSAGTKAIVMLHGVNSIRDDPSVGILEMAVALSRAGYAMLMFDFRAHGESSGTEYSLGILEVRDVAGALRYLKGRGATEVGVIGYSMGAATALLAAPEHPEIRAIVADAPFADLAELFYSRLHEATGLPRVFNRGVTLMIRAIIGQDITSIKPVQAMARLEERPLLLIHGTADDIVPVEQTYTLQTAGVRNPNLETWIVPGSSHAQAYRDHPEEYLSRVISFFDRNLR
ncbi:MAG: alpha/beta fold hydrolase [Chloroflexi bacterium]|nr:alpha/beta fold hydrolase [Chloroflexota bacterium]